MGREVFSRFEKKYLLTEEQYQMVSQRIAEHVELDPFNRKNGLYTICNLYYDTDEDTLIRKSLAKPVYKEKLRLRSYGVPSANDRAYLEMKKKFKGKVYKRRTSIIIDEADPFVISHTRALHTEPCNHQVLDEIDFFCNRYELIPKVYIAYDRLAYGQDDLRITFDTNIRTRRDELRLEAGDHGDPILARDVWLMEIKVSHSMPIWLSDLLAACGAFSMSFSKYGREFLKHLNEDRRLTTYDHSAVDPAEYIYQTIPPMLRKKGA